MELNATTANVAEQESSKDTLGIWVYILSDTLLFASFFATFAVLRGSTFGGPTAGQILSLPYALTETLILLTSSFTNGLAMLSAHAGSKKQTLFWLIITALLGMAFLGLESHEFANLVLSGNGFTRSGFLSSFFGLVGLHGLHVTAGILWLAAVFIQIVLRGLSALNVKKLLIFSIFWHFLDIIWIFIFTIVYLMSGIF